MNEVAKKMRKVLPQLIEELNAIPNNDFYNELVSEGVEFEPLEECNGGRKMKYINKLTDNELRELYRCLIEPNAVIK